MAKESVKARERKREKLVAQYAERRAALKAAGDYAGLDKLPKNSSAVRLHNRCQISGRPKAYYRKLKMSRIALRDLASEGQIPGMVKSSW